VLQAGGHRQESAVPQALDGVSGQLQLAQSGQAPQRGRGHLCQEVSLQVQLLQHLGGSQGGRGDAPDGVPSEVEPAQPPCPSQVALRQLPDAVVLQVEGDEGGQEVEGAGGQAREGVVVQVEVGQARGPLEGGGRQGGEAVVGEVEVDEALQPPQCPGTQRPDAAALQVQGHQLHQPREGARGHRPEGVSAQVEEAGVPGEAPGDLPQVSVLAGRVAEIGGAGAPPGALPAAGRPRLLRRRRGAGGQLGAATSHLGGSQGVEGPAAEGRGLGAGPLCLHPRHGQPVVEGAQEAGAEQGVPGQADPRQPPDPGQRWQPLQLVFTEVQRAQLGAAGKGVGRHVLEGGVVQEEVLQGGHGQGLLGHVGDGIVAQVQPGSSVQPGQGLAGQRLQLVVVQAQPAQGGQGGEGLTAQHMEGIVGQPEPPEDLETLEDHVWEIDQSICPQVKDSEGTQMAKSTQLDLLDSVPLQDELLEGGQPVQGLLVEEGYAVGGQVQVNQPPQPPERPFLQPLHVAALQVQVREVRGGEERSRRDDREAVAPKVQFFGELSVTQIQSQVTPGLPSLPPLAPVPCPSLHLPAGWCQGCLSGSR